MYKKAFVLIVLFTLLSTVASAQIFGGAYNPPGLAPGMFCKITGCVWQGDLDLGGNTIFNGTIEDVTLINVTIISSTIDNVTLIDSVQIQNPIWVNRTGDTMTGNLNMSGNNITNVNTLFVSNITGNSPVTFTSQVIIAEGFNITSQFYLGSGKFLTDINSSAFSENATFAEIAANTVCSSTELLLGGNGSCINFLSVGIDTQKDTVGPFLSNDSTTIFFNATLLNETIIDVSAFADTNETVRFNNLVNIDCSGSDKATGFEDNGTIICSIDLVGSFTNGTSIQVSFIASDDWSNITIFEAQILDLIHTIDTQKDTAGPFLLNDSTTIFFNDTLLNDTINELIGNITLQNVITNIGSDGGNFTASTPQDSINITGGDSLFTGIIGNILTVNLNVVNNVITTFTSGITILSTLNTTGDAVFGSEVDITGDVTIGGDTSIGGDLEVLGDITGGSPVRIRGGLNVTGNANFTNNIRIQGMYFGNASGLFNLNITPDQIESLNFTIGSHTIDTNRSDIEIIQVASIYNNTNFIKILINAVNTTTNIEDLGFTIGAHAVDTNRSDSEILVIASVYNDTLFIIAVNSTTNIEALGFVIGDHTNLTQQDILNFGFRLGEHTNFTQADIEAFGFVIGQHTNRTDEDILAVASVYNDTALINAVNTTVNIEGLGFTTGPHTVDTQKDTVGPFLSNDSTTIFFNATLLNETIIDLDTNETVRFNNLVAINCTLTDKQIGVFENGTIICFPDLIDDGDWIVGDGVLYNDTNNTLVGIGTSSPSAKLFINDTLTPFPVLFSNNTLLHYSFELGSSDIAFDTSFNSNRGGIDAAERIPSKGGNGTGNQSIEFFGDGFIHTDTSSDFDIINNFTISLWFYMDVTQGQTLISKNNNITEGYMIRVGSSRRLRVTYLHDGIDIKQRTSGSVSLNEWHHVAVSMNISDMFIYLDGVLESTSGHVDDLEGTNTDFFIANNPALTEPFDGRIDEVIIHDYMFNSSDALQVFNFGPEIINTTVPLSSNTLFIVNNPGIVGKSGIPIIVDTLGDVGIGIDNPQFPLHVGGAARFTRDVHLEEDLIVEGNIFGASPVKILGGVIISGGELSTENIMTKNGTQSRIGNLQVVGNLSGSSPLKIIGGVDIKDGGLKAVGNINITGTIEVSENIITKELTIRNDTKVEGDLQVLGNLIGASPLKVSGGIIITDDNDSDSHATLRLRSSEDGAAKIAFVQNDSKQWVLQVKPGQNNYFQILSRVASRIFITITHDGKTGFGESNTNPKSTVDIKGTFRIQRNNIELDESGTISYTDSFMKIDTFGLAATDDLETITGGSIGDIIILTSENNARDITIKDSTGNIALSGDFTLDNVRDKITLIKNTADRWDELSRSDNQ